MAPISLISSIPSDWLSNIPQATLVFFEGQVPSMFLQLLRVQLLRV